MTTDYELKERAKELYIFDGFTLEQAAKETGLAGSTLKRWSAEEDWGEKRAEYRKTLGEIKKNTTKLRERLITKALNSLEAMATIDSQDMHGFRAVLAAADLKGQENEKGPDIDRPKLFLEDMEFVAETLKEIDPEGLKVFARNFEVIISRYKEQHAKAA